MKYIAYKTAQNVPNLPNGFIIEHFETDQTAVEGYLVVPVELFSALIANNSVLIKSMESAKGVVTSDNAPAQPVLPKDKNAESIDPALKPQPSTNDADLFKQFLAWKAAQDTAK